MKKLFMVFVGTLLAASTLITAHAENIQTEQQSGVLPIYSDAVIRKPHKNITLLTNEELPERFDLRNVDGNGKSYVSSVKNQNYTQNCWAYAFAASAESCWLRDTDCKEEIDVSEDHMDYSTTKTVVNQDNPDGGKNTLNSGGQSFMAAAYVSRGAGLVLESEFDYSYYNYYGDDDRPVGYLSDTYIKPSFGVTDIVLSNYFDEYEPGNALTDKYYDEIINQLKNDIYTNKTAVTASILYDIDYAGSLYPTYYNPNGGFNISSHAATIIGWDDTYSKEYFNTPPQGDGAWIVKDSYGTSREGEEAGFYYLSYYDLSTYCTNTQVIGMEDYRNGLPYDNRYYYDRNWFHTSLGYEDNDNTVYGMNVFKKQDGEENVVSVNLAFSGPTNYEVYIADDTENVDVSKLTPCLSGAKDRAGYYQLELDEPVKISGDSFAVIVKYSDDEDCYLVPVSMKSPYPYWWYDYNLTFTPKTSFISKEGSDWEDISVQNEACVIKAFTTDVVKKNTVTIQKTASDDSINTSETIVWVYDENGNRISPNADGTYSLINGNYIYSSERSHLGTDFKYEPITGNFTVSGDMTLAVPVPENLLTVKNKVPYLSNTSLEQISPYTKNYGYLGALYNYGSGDTAATDIDLYLVYNNGEKKLLEKGKDYDMNEYWIFLFKPDCYILSDNEFLYDNQNSILTFEAVYNDIAQTTGRFYVEIGSIDMIEILNLYIFENSDATKNSIEEYLIGSIKGTESVNFSDDFEITPMSIKGKVTIVNNGTIYEQDYSEYNRKLYNLKYIKKSNEGIVYKIDKLTFRALFSGGYHNYYVVSYDKDGYMASIKKTSFYGNYITIPYDSNSQTLKMFMWLYVQQIQGKSTSVQIPLSDVFETTIEQ